MYYKACVKSEGCAIKCLFFQKKCIAVMYILKFPFFPPALFRKKKKLKLYLVYYIKPHLTNWVKAKVDYFLSKGKGAAFF